ncbi:MAG: His-Xaa-Ser system radical SAM maturase HxsB [Undibacterium umbellatum]|uniref:His-Xaa-Ser system radical SAM maturase HxsB n=1 Tax=Undibacterium umbellatum TaxID=2762300 RepID=UPI003BB6157C
MAYSTKVSPFNYRRLTDGNIIAVSASGDYAFLQEDELTQLLNKSIKFSLERQAYLRSRFFLSAEHGNQGTKRLLLSRQAAKKETVQNGPSLHIIVPTLQCAHSCKYCQVSRSLEDKGHTISLEHLNLACDTIFQSPAKTLTVEFQGGDPLLRLDLVKHAILRISERNQSENRTVRFVIATTLHQLNEEMCSFFKQFGVFLSISIDGPAELHNKNRPTPTRDAYERTLRGIELARTHLGMHAVSALMTTTKESLLHPEAIVDEYVRLGLNDIFLRPLSSYGFAKRNQARLGYSLKDFSNFYLRGLERILYWNRQGVELREVYTSIILNKILSTFDCGYVDLQSPTGAGLGVLVYNYDGYVYPSDEARMLKETGDLSLRLGPIGTSIEDLLQSDVQKSLINASLVDETPGCQSCAYNRFCAPNPVDSQAQFHTVYAAVESTEHCQRHTWLFDTLFTKVKTADDWTMDLFYRWSRPTTAQEVL